MITLPRDDAKKQDVLQRIALLFEQGKEYDETTVNDMIDAFGAEDHALVRRELVNFGYLAKDSVRGRYWLKKAMLSNEESDRIRRNQARMEKHNVY